MNISDYNYSEQLIRHPFMNQPASINPNAFYRIRELATTASRRAYSYQSKDGKNRVRNARPESRGLLPLGEATIWEKVRKGIFPPPTKLSERVTVWKGSDILEWLESKQ